MSALEINIEAAKQCITDCLTMISEGKNEQVIRDSFTSYLRQIFPTQPSWVTRHIQGSEAAVKINKGKGISTGFVDNLVDLTAIEYESDLTKTPKFNEGHRQVKDYCSGLVNKGHDPELVIGILSDTVRWYAYSIDIDQLPDEPLTRDNIVLIELEAIDCSNLSDTSTSNLVNFLCKYLGRIGARPVSAYSIAKDLGFDSPFCQEHIVSIDSVVSNAFANNPRYSSLIANLWCNFVSYLREDGTPDQFDIKTYIDEYYILTLGKLICANYIEKKALSSEDAELKDILSGVFFENKGLINVVEYDYFGWLNSEPYLSELLAISKDIQQDLVAYNFDSKPDEDLFGRMMAQLANRSQRILLGQEWTPSWLSYKLVSEVSGNIPNSEPLQLIDMCCGSGSMVVEAVQIAKLRIEELSSHLSEEEKIQQLVQAITGFDIDPLAVMLSKINWILSAMDWLEPLGIHQISIPVYHADSLFAITPISSHLEDDESTVYSLKIAEYTVDLPEYLVTPTYRSFFDSLIDTGYHIAIEPNSSDPVTITDEILTAHIEEIKINIGMEVSSENQTEILNFLKDFIEKVDILNRDGRNGIWAYILRNSFRPGLVAGQFNGLVSNPPWLALSKIANNPYQQILKLKAESFNIKPQGSSHLHIELATIFLLHSVQKYLVGGAPMGCIVPETILNGHHHNPFRKNQYYTSQNQVELDINKIWKVGKNVFKNNAVVLFGTKSAPDSDSTSPIQGNLASENDDLTPLIFYRNAQGNRTSWSEQELPANSSGFYTPANFRQGADIMPRTLLFYETSITSNDRFYSVKSINPVTSNLAFTVKDAKKHQDFSLNERLLPKDLFFDVITSNLLTYFNLADTQKALLPVRKDDNGIWEMIPEPEVNAKGSITRNTFREIFREIDPTNGNIESIFNLLNTRGKLTQQLVGEEGFIVFTGAGGGKVCSAYIAIEEYDHERLILDQTVYWAQVETEDEAIYLTGLLNSQAISQIIEDFQPRGAFGKRHVHKLPFGVTPPFDNTQVGHQEVVEKTKALILEYNALIGQNDDVAGFLDPNSSTLSRRRKKLFGYISNLDAYTEYELACKSLYGVE